MENKRAFKEYLYDSNYSDYNNIILDKFFDIVKKMYNFLTQSLHIISIFFTSLKFKIIIMSMFR